MRPFAGHGFARPVVDLPGVTTTTLTQGKKQVRARDVAGVRAAWRATVQQVWGAGLGLAHRIAMPASAQRAVA